MACNDTSQDRRSVTLSEQQDAHSVDIFKRSWEVYQTVVAHDSVHHKQLFGAIRDYLEGRPGDKLSILDLGCGDAGCLASIIAGTPSLRDRITSYTGIDASAPALALCRTNMAAALGGGGGGAAGAAEIDLREGGMLEGLAAAAERGERFDVVLASLSLHHLSEAEKARAVEAVGRVLAPGGAFVICDIFLLPGWSRDEFMRQYHADVYEVNGGWQGQDKAGKDLLWAHISNYDFPVELSHYQAAAAAARAAPGGAFISAEGRVLTEVFVYKVAAWEAPPAAAAEAAAAAS